MNMILQIQTVLTRSISRSYRKKRKRKRKRIFHWLEIMRLSRNKTMVLGSSTTVNRLNHCPKRKQRNRRKKERKRKSYSRNNKKNKRKWKTRSDNRRQCLSKTIRVVSISEQEQEQQLLSNKRCLRKEKNLVDKAFLELLFSSSSSKDQLGSNQGLGLLTVTNRKTNKQLKIQITFEL